MEVSTVEQFHCNDPIACGLAPAQEPEPCPGTPPTGISGHRAVRPDSPEVAQNAGDILSGRLLFIQRPTIDVLMTAKIELTRPVPVSIYEHVGT
jgi:hypothetical protein